MARRYQRNAKRAYPRSRGGTVPRVGKQGKDWGLSPLARGNRPRHQGRRCAQGPIPARAGEPSAKSAAWMTPGAYPRSRGGTQNPHHHVSLHWGLSPLARGNLLMAKLTPEQQGPIPARAGEPPVGVDIKAHLRAYPRSRGGTSHN